MTEKSALAHRDFRFLLVGQTTSQFGAQVSSVAIPLLAVVTLHASPWQLGVVNASATISFAIIGLPAGVWLDRLRRRPVLVASDLARAVFLISIPIAAWVGELTITQLILVSLLAGFARVFFDVGYQSYLPSLLGPGQVLAGNSAMETARAGGQFAGPGTGGWLVGALGAANVIAIQGATFAISAVSLAIIRTREPKIELATPERPSLLRQIREGLSFVAHNPVLRALAITSAMSNVAFAVASAVTFIFLSRTLGLTASVIGIVVAVGSVTVMVGAALTTRISKRFGSARIVWLALAVTGPITLVGPFAQRGWWVLLVVAGGAAGELGQIIYAITSVSLRQRLCPDSKLGRVNATMRFLIMGLFPLGALVGGGLGEVVGLRVTLFVAQAIIALSALPIYLVLRHAREITDLSPW